MRTPPSRLPRGLQIEIDLAETRCGVVYLPGRLWRGREVCRLSRGCIAAKPIADGGDDLQSSACDIACLRSLRIFPSEGMDYSAVMTVHTRRAEITSLPNVQFISVVWRRGGVVLAQSALHLGAYRALTTVDHSRPELPA